MQGAVQDKLAHSPIGIPEPLGRVLSTGAEGEIVMLISCYQPNTPCYYLLSKQ